MLLSQLKHHLTTHPSLTIDLPTAGSIPAHFHLSEIGLVQKTFIDCGGKVRRDHRVSLQLWTATDYDHRLEAEKALRIIQLAEERLELPDVELEVEYQGETTIGKYGLGVVDGRLQLQPLATTCLAIDTNGSLGGKIIGTLAKKTNCAPGGGCC